MPTSFMTGSIVGKRFYKKVQEHGFASLVFFGCSWYNISPLPSAFYGGTSVWCIGFQRIHNQGITILGGNTKAHVFVYLILHSLTQMTSAMFSSFAVQWHWSLDMAIVSSSVVVEDKPRSRTSDVSYEEQDDPDGGLERRSLSGDS
ncbi:hypothetical protein Bca4012_000171 [Brassica carinata]|uniref:Uncharacterized protein n=2 Tax=Brassica oleracea TaxID=3712 RepID=A0A0D3AZM9_BRAOL|nr:unnamed protein product [Brassica oleracea]